MNGKLFIAKIHVQNRNIVGDSVRKLAYDIPERNFSKSGPRSLNDRRKRADFIEVYEMS